MNYDLWLFDLVDHSEEDSDVDPDWNPSDCKSKRSKIFYKHNIGKFIESDIFTGKVCLIYCSNSIGISFFTTIYTSA